MKHLKIEIPNGYEIDKEKSTFETIVFKEIKPLLPTSWDKLNDIAGYYVDSSSIVVEVEKEEAEVHSNNRNIFATKQQAKASIVLAQLSQLREVYRNGWLPNWNDHSNKFVIRLCNNDISKDTSISTDYFLSFKDRETRDLFFIYFKDLIEKAKPLFS